MLRPIPVVYIGADFCTALAPHHGMRAWFGLLLSIAAGACGPTYAYVPTTGASVSVHGHPGADYAMPPQSPRGDVRVASFGLTQVTPNPPAQGPSARALHVRLVANNDGETPWTLDARADQIDLEGVGMLEPTFASVKEGTPPVVTVPPRSTRVLDLFYVVPPTLEHESKIPRFEAIWRVVADDQLVTIRTPFERLMLASGDDGSWDYGVEHAWFGPYWLNPAYRSQYLYLGPGVEVQEEHAPGVRYVPPPPPHPHE